MHLTPTQPIRNFLPGISLCTAVAAAAFVLEQIELHLFGAAWLETLVLAIVLGTLIRSFLPLPTCLTAGIQFSAKTVLEMAVVLLGASISTKAISDAGWPLFAGIVIVVFLSIFTSYWIGRAFGLAPRLCMLIACGNSICGNSAIAATAPVIGAGSDDVAASIAFTAVLGIAVVLLLPLAVPLIGFSSAQYGIFAGMTVYAVPQVLAATAPVSALSLQIGTLVKLIRVLMLGPVILALALFGSPSEKRISLTGLVPWFIIGFAVMMASRSLDIIPSGALATIGTLAHILTIVSMAALGMTVDARTVAHAGGRVVVTALLSIISLGLISFCLIFLLGSP